MPDSVFFSINPCSELDLGPKEASLGNETARAWWNKGAQG